MKKFSIIPVRYVVIVCLLPLGACHKFIDWKDFYHKHNPGCRIEKIISQIHPFNLDEPLIADFNYNSKGDPTSVIFDFPGTGRPHLRFHYDNKGRLLDYAGPYNTGPNSGYEFYYRYYYDNKNRVIRDSSYGLGNYYNGLPQPNLSQRGFGHYEYDAYDRIKKVTRFTIYEGTAYPLFTEEFNYDENGNLVGAGPYDNKTNFHLTNKIWMLIDRNYSRNNPVPAIHYNSSQLPTKYDLAENSLRFLYAFDISTSEIFYQCKK